MIIQKDLKYTHSRYYRHYVYYIIQSFILVNYINFVSCIHIYVGMSLLLTINNSIYIYIYFSQKQKQKQKQKIIYITSENKIKNKIKL